MFTTQIIAPVPRLLPIEAPPVPRKASIILPIEAPPMMGAGEFKGAIDIKGNPITTPRPYKYGDILPQFIGKGTKGEQIWNSYKYIQNLMNNYKTKKTESKPTKSEEYGTWTPGLFVPSSFGGWTVAEVCQWIERQKAKGFDEKKLLALLKRRLTPATYEEVKKTYYHPLAQWEKTIPVNSLKKGKPVPTKGFGDEAEKGYKKVKETVEKVGSEIEKITSGDIFNIDKKWLLLGGAGIGALILIGLMRK